MRKTIPLLLILTGAVLSACGGGSPIGPQPTYTLLPTYTPLPTFTPLPQSTATATFMPSPTPPEEAEESADLPPSATPNTGFEVTLAFGSNLRAGPGTTYETITFLEAGEVLSVQGRDVNGGWIFGETSTGQSGWVRITQIEGRLDFGLIPLAETIPTPEATTTAVADAGDEDTTPEPTEEGDEDDEDDDNGEEGGAD
ncbi:MAG: SH3 domain-containing protein, partial [Anaerolineae bacterium]